MECSLVYERRRGVRAPGRQNSVKEQRRLAWVPQTLPDFSEPGYELLVPTALVLVAEEEVEAEQSPDVAGALVPVQKRRSRAPR